MMRRTFAKGCTGVTQSPGPALSLLHPWGYGITETLTCEYLTGLWKASLRWWVLYEPTQSASGLKPGWAEISHSPLKARCLLDASTGVLYLGCFIRC